MITKIRAQGVVDRVVFHMLLLDEISRTGWVIERRILFLVDVNSQQLGWLLRVRKGSKDFEMNVAYVSSSLDPKVSAIHNLSGPVNRLKLTVFLTANLFDHAFKP